MVITIKSNTPILRYGAFPVFCLLIACPLLALPFVIYGIYLQKKSAYFLFALFLGLLSWLQIPFGDLFRHTMQYYDEFRRPIEHIFDFNDGFHDFIGTLGKWILINNGLPYQYFRLISMTESFYILSLIFIWMIKNSPRFYTRSQAFIRFLFLFLFFEFIQTTSGVRYCFAVYNYIYGLHLWFNLRNRIPAIAFFLLSICIHDTMLFFIPLSFILYLGCYSRKRSIIILLLSFVLALAAVSALSVLMGRKAEFYFEGGTSIAGNTFQNVTIYGFILFTASRLFLAPFAYLAFRYFKPNAVWIRMMIVWTIVMCVFITNGVMIFRIAVFISAIIPYMIIDLECFRNIKQSVFKLLLCCAYLNTLFNTVNYRNYILNSRFEYIATPVPVILNYSYEKSWILDHIDGNTIKKTRYLL